MRRGPSALTLLGALSIASPAQAADVQTWFESQVAFTPHKRVSLSVEPQLRLRIDDPGLAAVMVDLGVEYKPARWVALGVAYRPVYERDGDDEMALRHRLQADLRFKLRLEAVRLDYRLRLQEKIRPASNDKLRAKMRHRVRAQYRGFEDWRPELAVEQFFALGDFDSLQRDTLRVTAGVSYRLAKRQRLAFFYRAEVLHADPDDPTVHIFGLGWGLEVR